MSKTIKIVFNDGYEFEFDNADMIRITNASFNISEFSAELISSISIIEE